VSGATKYDAPEASNGRARPEEGVIPDGLFAVVIPTHNRSALVTRAIDSVYATGWRDVEVIVVDDASEDNTVEVVARNYPNVTLLRTPFNGGPGAARNLGIEAANSKWVLMLDDDDLLMPEALRAIHHALCETAESEKYPVVQFARSNGTLRVPFLIARLRDFVDGGVTGDFAAVIQTRLFRERQFRYPKCRIGGESLLWYDIAQICGIPSWSTTVIQMTSDASSNLCSIGSQLSRPREYAELQEETLRAFGNELFEISPTYYRKKVLGGITYRLLAGDRKIARASIAEARSLRSYERIALACLSLLPQTVIRKTFETYRTTSF
jgi:glycosyltransferase involved in cell wall biosynthesis